MHVLRYYYNAHYIRFNGFKSFMHNFSFLYVAPLCITNRAYDTEHLTFHTIPYHTLSYIYFVCVNRPLAKEALW